MSGISSLNSLASLATRPVGNTQPVRPVQRVKQIEREDQPQKLPKTPAQEPDQYTQAPPKPSAGLYYVGQDEDGQKKIFFDAPTEEPTNGGAKAPEALKASESPKAAPAANKKDGQKANTLTTNTDKVDAELRRLRNKQSKLQQQVNQTADPDRKAELQKKLNQVKSDLRTKDNDSYRRQHAQYTKGTPF